MASRLKRANFVRAAVAAAACSLPLVAVGTAQAAIAGANPANSTDRPNLVSAQSLSSSEVLACFDKTVSNVTYGDFVLGGYAAGNQSATGTQGATGTPSSKCVDVAFGGGVNVNDYTILTAKANAAEFGSSGSATSFNADDSTTLISSTSRNGITGRTTAPDLTAITKPNSSNSLIFQFDQGVTPTGNNAFFVYNQAGTRCYSVGQGPIGTSGTQIIATFNSACTSVNNAIIGGVDSNKNGGPGPAVSATNDPTATNPLETQPIPGGPGNDQPVFNPVLTKAQLDPTNPDQVDYFFSKDVTVNNPNGFCVALSTGSPGEICSGAGGTTQASSTEIIASFGGQLAGQQEYAVVASAADNAVQDTTSNHNPSLASSMNIGGNANGFARGFTTAPDVTAVAFNTSNDQATVNVDQRLCDPGATGTPSETTLNCASGGLPVVPANIIAYPQFGTGPGGGAANVPASSYSVVNPTQGPGPQQVKVQFPANTLKGTSFLVFEGCKDGGGGSGAFESPLQLGDQGCDDWSVSQDVAPVSTAAIMKAVRGIKAEQAKKAHKKAKKHHRKHHAKKATRKA